MTVHINCDVQWVYRSPRDVEMNWRMALRDSIYMNTHIRIPSDLNPTVIVPKHSPLIGRSLPSKAPSQRLDLSRLQLVEILFAQMNSSNLVSHSVRFDIFPLFAQSTLDILLCNLWFFQCHLHHILICSLYSPYCEIDRRAHFTKRYTGDF